MKLKRLIEEQNTATPEFLKSANDKFKSRFGIDLKLSVNNIVWFGQGKQPKITKLGKLTKFDPLLGLAVDSAESEYTVYYYGTTEELQVEIYLYLTTKQSNYKDQVITAKYRYQDNKWYLWNF